MRRTPSVDALIPALYLKGISTGDFTEALAAILGEKASGLSATNIVRLKAGWEADYKAWSQRDLSQKRYVYWWADGVYFNVRLDEERSCVLVLIGATEDGTRELLAGVDGYRESTQSWRELLGQLKRLGLTRELGIVIGTKAQYVPVERALEHVAGIASSTICQSATLKSSAGQGQELRHVRPGRPLSRHRRRGRRRSCARHVARRERRAHADRQHPHNDLQLRGNPQLSQRSPDADAGRVICTGTLPAVGMGMKPPRCQRCLQVGDGQRVSPAHGAHRQSPSSVRKLAISDSSAHVLE
jgi:Transposase, Mutator family